MGQRIKSFVQSIKDLLGVPAVVIDGSLYVAVAFFGALVASFGGDEAEKYITGATLFWLKTFVGGIAAGALALKMFRSTAFSDSKPKEIITNAAGDTQIITKQPKVD